MRALAFAMGCCVLVFCSTRAFAGSDTPLTPNTPIEFSAQPEVAPPSSEEHADGWAGEGPDAPPPVRPRRRGLVLESTAGVLGFIGQFRHLAPPAYWMHAQAGYEVLSWLLLFGEGELAFTTTSEAEDPSHMRAFPIWGFGGGARATVHAGSIGVFLQGDLGALAADVPHDAFTYLGFQNAESFGLQYGGRAGIEWYHRDRHIAVTLQAGGRVAQGFAKLEATDIPLMWDAALGLRYTF